MSDPTYTLEWRGAKKSGLSYASIDAGIAAGDLHSLYKINVDGRWVVLRDFLEQQRAMLAASRHAPPMHAAAAASQPSAYDQPASYAPPSSYAQPPAPPLHAAPFQPLSFERNSEPEPGAMPPPPMSQRSHSQKPVWLWPVVIISATVCILLVIVTVYMIATSRSSSQRTAAATPDTKTEAKAGPLEMRPFSLTGKEFYPSALVSTSKVDWNGDAQSAEDKKTEEDARLRKDEIPLYGDENSWLGIELGGLKKGSKVSVEITAEGFMYPSKEQVTVGTLGGNGSARVMPKIVWNFDALTKVHQQRPINVVFSASVDGKEVRQVTETYTMRSINDCPLLLRDESGEGGMNLSFLFAAYVNEDHPQVQVVLKEALESGLVKKFNGYQSEDPREVRMQVFSIWNALQRRGIKYSNIVTTRPGERVDSQSVRFMQESIDNHQANCVDGSVLMASVLHKIGIQCYLVLVPNHCFLAFDEVENSAALPTGLETTMLGHDNITDVKKMEFLSEKQQSAENLASAKTFMKALEVGSNRIQSCARNLQGQGGPQYRLISIEAARNNGIDPIPYAPDK